MTDPWQAIAISGIAGWLLTQVCYTLSTCRWDRSRDRMLSSFVAERRDLYTRLQAGTLADYAAHKPKLEPETHTGLGDAEVSQRMPVIESDTFVSPGEPAPLPGDAKADFDRLMGGQL